jgi:hypothetical protein
MEDMPGVFTKADYLTKIDNTGYDFYLVDDVEAAKKALSGVTRKITIIHFKNMADDSQQHLHEVEMMARSGFLSVVGLT